MLLFRWEKKQRVALWSRQNTPPYHLSVKKIFCESLSFLLFLLELYVSSPNSFFLSLIPVFPFPNSEWANGGCLRFFSLLWECPPRPPIKNQNWRSGWRRFCSVQIMILELFQKTALWFWGNSTLGVTKGSASETTRHATKPQEGLKKKKKASSCVFSETFHFA